ncbi:MAG TPA: YihY/virulence factor BrkB family protein [Solirubrobacteraceae bacterium]|nr:YihY/virulence factor BrkB family protein [Solirubrobacteraceae bacterium]
MRESTTGNVASWIWRLDRWQRRRRWAGLAVGVGKRYAEDGAARHGARIAYYAFFSVFPLMLALVSILGFVLEDDAALRQEILDSAYADMPVLGPFIRNDIGTIEGSGIALALGIAIALWAGLGVTVALGQALDRVWSIPPVEQASWFARRLRGLAMLLVGGLALVASSVLGGFAASGRFDPAIGTAASILLSLAVDAVILLGAFRLLTTATPSLRELMPGVAVAATGLLVLQTVGGRYVDSTIGRASNTYGLFATVIGLLTWLSVAAQLILIAAELNAVRSLGLWPRSLSGTLTDADRKALEGYAQASLHDTRATITVTWSPEEP